MVNPFEMPTPFFNQEQDIAGRPSHVPDAALQTTSACTGSLELQAERLHTEPIRQNRMLMQVNEAEQTSGGSNSWEPAPIQSFPIRFIRKGLWTLFQRKHILVFMIACLGLFGVLNPSSSIATGATAQAKTRMITVNRSQLALTCMGEGSPTVLLESDLATASDEWIPVQEQLAATTQVCRYDRAGLGQSDLPYRPKLGFRMPRTSSQMVDDLHSLLHQAGIAAPYILVGHGFGTLNVRLYAARYPSQVAGLVLVDGFPDDLFARLNEVLPPEPVEAYHTQLDGNLEEVDVERSIEQVQEAKIQHNAPGLDRTLMQAPVMILTHGYPLAVDQLSEGMPSDVLEEIWQDLQADLLNHAPEGTLIKAEYSGHMIPLEQPSIIVTATQQLIRNSSTKIVDPTE